MDHLRDAESKITKILKEYEAVSGNLVTSVSICGDVSQDSAREVQGVQARGLYG